MTNASSQKGGRSSPGRGQVVLRAEGPEAKAWRFEKMEGSWVLVSALALQSAVVCSGPRPALRVWVRAARWQKEAGPLAVGREGVGLRARGGAGPPRVV